MCLSGMMIGKGEGEGGGKGHQGRSPTRFYINFEDQGGVRRTIMDDRLGITIRIWLATWARQPKLCHFSHFPVNFPDK